ncbi:nitroreductase [Porphyromonas gulae]|uniref:Acg family FMN-binding oxidoreductase n=1 Tax=Porphyromonas gulae TaxID=111105 RepID=UPI00052CF366|nr:nitroreductase family protein [Porphyromonas gulae]KGN76507.1 nitroreductase [Porphyromonas gulae]KGO04521.1 nitroreductase [Porphyromonas gulae]
MNKIFAQDTDYLFLIEQAVKAPSGHNTQPWTFRIKETGIDILPDFTKTLPVVDPDNRELFVSLGCATENLCIAAAHRGYETMVSIAENGTIHIGFTKQDSDTPSPLFPYISVRQTNRSVYNGSIIPVNDITALAEKNDMEPFVGIHFFKSGTQEFDAISEMVCKGNSIQMRDKKFKEELQQWMRYNKKHQDATRDGLSYAVFGAPNLPRFIVKTIITRLINEKSQNRNDRRKIASSSHFVLFTSLNNTVEQWIKLGRVLERLLLKATGMGISHAYMNQPNEEQGLSRKMAETLGIAGEYPTVLIRLGYGSKMPYSLRRSAESCIIPNSFT